MFHEFQSHLVLTGNLLAQSALRVGAGRATEPGGSDLPVLRDTQDRPYVPGSSLKGVLRSRVEQMLRAFGDHGYTACNPTDDKAWCILSGERKRERGWKYPDHSNTNNKPIGIRDLEKGLEDFPTEERDKRLAARVWKESCLVCRTFGSPWLASHLHIKDLQVDPELWFNQYQVRDGVAIDRDTETAAEGLLYDFEVVPADTVFRCEIRMENGEPWQLGMLLLGLKPFERGEMALGGFRSRGLGVVRLDWQGRYYEVPRRGNPGGPDPDWVIRYLEGREAGVDARQKMEASVDEFRRALIGASTKGGERDA